MDKTHVLKAQSPAALAEEYIIKSIWNKHFPPGSDLPAERELAEKIGVTRTTLREVLQRLARDGWINIQHGKPTKVNNVWETAGPNIIETLIKLDVKSAPLIISNMLSLRTKMSEFYIYDALKLAPQEALKLFDGLENLNENAQAYSDFDYYLFRELTFIANKPMYGLIFNSFRSLYAKVARLYFSNPQGRALNLKFYRSLKTLCETGNYEAVPACMQEHRQQSGEIWRTMLSDLPENFAE